MPSPDSIAHRDAGQDRLPEIGLRVPGAWSSPGQLRDALPAGYRLALGCMVMPGGTRVEILAHPPDDEFPQVFRLACRRQLSRKERGRVDAYKVNLCLIGPGGSKEAVRTMLEAGAALVRAGGLGVFVDNSAVAHWSDDWQALCDQGDDCDAFMAFVATICGTAEIRSLGMHVFGLRDAVLRRTGDDDVDCHALWGFLGRTLEPERPILEGDLVGDAKAPMFRLVREACTRFTPDSPLHNPYGVWRLVELDEES